MKEEQAIENEMKRIFDERGGSEFPTPKEFELLEEEARESLDF